MRKVMLVLMGLLLVNCGAEAKAIQSSQGTVVSKEPYVIRITTKDSKDHIVDCFLFNTYQGVGISCLRAN